MLYKANANQYNNNKYRSITMVCLEWGNLTTVNNLCFEISYQDILINFDMFPKINNGYFVAYFDQVYSWNSM